jgi:hypothetical protein
MASKENLQLLLISVNDNVCRTHFEEVVDRVKFFICVHRIRLPEREISR